MTDELENGWLAERIDAFAAEAGIEGPWQVYYFAADWDEYDSSSNYRVAAHEKCRLTLAVRRGSLSGIITRIAHHRPSRRAYVVAIAAKKAEA